MIRKKHGNQFSNDGVDFREEKEGGGMENKKRYKLVYSHAELGRLVILSNGAQITNIFIEGMEKLPSDLTDGAALPVLRTAAAWLDDYFAGQRPDPYALPLFIKGTAFQQLVWKRLLQIPYGKTVSYGQLAVELAVQMGKQKMSAQAIGGAVGRNPISIVIPCHRVIGTNGSLIGYASGLERKCWLLQHETGNNWTI